MLEHFQVCVKQLEFILIYGYRIGLSKIRRK